MRTRFVWVGSTQRYIAFGDSLNLELCRFDVRAESLVGLTTSEDCLPATPTSSGVSRSYAHEVIYVDLVFVDAR